MKHVLPFSNRPFKIPTWRDLALLVFFSLTAIYPVAAQNKIWDKTFGSNGSDELTLAIPTQDGGYLLGGTSSSGVSGDKTQVGRGDVDYWLVKLKADGSKMWDKTFGGKDYDVLTSVYQTSDGGYIIGGTSQSGISGDKSENFKNQFSFYGDYWVLKLDAEGNKVWDKTIGGSSYERLAAVLPTKDGGYLLGGTSSSGISGDKSEVNKGREDYWVVKLHADGKVEWDKTLGGAENDQLNSVLQTQNGDYVLGGTSTSGASGDKSEKSRDKNSSFTGDYWQDRS